MIELRGAAATRSTPLTLCRETFGQIGITSCTSFFFRNVSYVWKKKSNKNCLSWGNATYRMKVGVNGPPCHQGTCLAQGWHRGRKVLGCSLLPIQISRALDKKTNKKNPPERSCCVSVLLREWRLKHSWVEIATLPRTANKDADVRHLCSSQVHVWPRAKWEIPHTANTSLDLYIKGWLFFSIIDQFVFIFLDERNWLQREMITTTYPRFFCWHCHFSFPEKESII